MVVPRSFCPVFFILAARDVAGLGEEGEVSVRRGFFFSHLVQAQLPRHHVDLVCLAAFCFGVSRRFFSSAPATVDRPIFCRFR